VTHVLEPNVGCCESRIHLDHSIVVAIRCVTEYKIDSNITTRSRQGVDRSSCQRMSSLYQLRFQNRFTTLVGKIVVEALPKWREQFNLLLTHQRELHPYRALSRADLMREALSRGLALMMRDYIGGEA